MPDAAALRAAVEDTVDRALSGGEVTGLQVALWHGGRPVWSAAYGDLPWGRSVPLGSLTKLYTAAAVLRLAAEGRVNLRAPLAAAVPEAAHLAAPGAVVGDVLAHRSGLPSDWLPGMWAEGAPDWRRVWDEMAAEPRPEGAGAWSMYSNVGFLALGTLVERTAGLPFEEALNTLVLEPLGTGASWNRPSHVKEPQVRLVPAGGLYGTARDLGPILEVVLGRGPSPWGPRVGRRACRPWGEPLAADQSMRWGLGWIVIHGGLRGAGRVCWHRGATPGYASVALALPAFDVAVAVLAKGPKAPHVVEEAAVAAVEAAVGPAIHRDPGRGGARVGNILLEPARPGRYVTEEGVIRIASSPEGPRFSFGRRQTKLLPVGDGTYRMEGLPMVRLGFVRVGEALLLVRIEGDVRERIGVRLPAVVRVPRAWRRRTGPYDLLDPYGGAVGRVHLVYEDGLLQLVQYGSAVDPDRHARYVLLPRGPNRAVVAGMHRGAGVSVRAVGGELAWSGLRLVPRRPQPQTRGTEAENEP